MKRKINQVGSGTLTISLPKRWTKIYGLKKGQEIETEEDGAIFRIIAAPANTSEERNIHYSDANTFLTRMIIGPYIKGYSEFRITYDDPKIYSYILRVMNHMIGFEIVEQRDGFCRLIEITSGGEENFEKLEIRLFNVIKSFADQTHRILKGTDEDLSSLLEIEYNIDKLSLYCRRLLNKNKISGKTYDNTAMYVFVCQMERVGDELRQIIEYVDAHRIYKYNKNLEILFMTLDESLILISKMLNNYSGAFDPEKQHEYGYELRRIRVEAEEHKEKFFSGDGAFSVSSHHLFTCLEHIQHISEELF
jgi:phosphate uptake regulator